MDTNNRGANLNGVNAHTGTYLKDIHVGLNSFLNQIDPAGGWMTRTQGICLFWKQQSRALSRRATGKCRSRVQRHQAADQRRARADCRVDELESPSHRIYAGPWRNW